MAVSLAGAIARVQTLADAITGIKLVPDYPPEKLATAPAAVVYMGAGEWHCEAMQKRWRGNVMVEVLVGRNQPDIPAAYKLLTGFAEAFANKLESEPTLNGTCDQIMFPIRQEAPVLISYAQLEYVMLVFTVPVSCTNAIT